MSNEDYNQAKNVWSDCLNLTVKKKNDCHDLYLKSYVLENFRKTCMKHYNLDPTHYLRENGIRGGKTHTSKRY